MDAEGRYYIPGYIVAPGCVGDLQEDRFHTCPLADVVRPGSPIRDIIDTHRRLRVEGVRLVDLYPNPTPALMDSLTELDSALGSLRAEKERRAMEEAKRRANNG